jgi:hypothetical protein
VDCEASFDIVDESEVFAGFVDCNDIYSVLASVSEK